MLPSGQFFINEQVKQIQSKVVAGWQSGCLASPTIQIRLMAWGGHAEGKGRFPQTSCS